MQHHHPGKVLAPDLIRAGTLIKAQGDIIMFSPGSSYFSLLKQLHARVQARSGITAPSKSERFLCRLVLLRDRQFVLLEKGSWLAASAMLRTSRDAALLFMFAIIPRSYCGPTAFERIKRAFSEEVDHKICLVEPDLPIHDEPSRTPRYIPLT